MLISYYSADNAIKDFMEFYRQSFPDASVIPKMHILEEHVVPFENGVLAVASLGNRGHTVFTRTSINRIGRTIQFLRTCA